MECFRCDQEAVNECPRCGALYCDDHGAALCERCMDPALALPSHRVYRGSLLALLIGTVFAVWLLVRAPATLDADSPLPPSIAAVVASPTPTPTSPPPDAATATPTSAAPAASPVPSATPTPTPTPTATPEPKDVEHTVAPGDTMLSIAETYLPPGKDVVTFAEEIAAYNGLADMNAVSVGEVLRIPPE